MDDPVINLLIGLAFIFSLGWMLARIFTEKTNLYNCKSCGAPIVWVRMRSDKMMPVDANPDPRGNIEIFDGFGSVIEKTDLFPGRDRYISHWATCPNAQEHRKKADS
jgi:hypothetical protein